MRALTRAQLFEGIVLLIARLPVYRTYMEAGALSIHEDDRAAVERALADAGAAALIRAPLLALLRDIFLGDIGSLGEEQRAERDAFVLRFQQVSGPATAKGIEDTALYRYSPLLSLNEVGADPGGELRDAVGYLHDTNIERSTRWPSTMLATSTHDTKRSADVRSRIDALSEIPHEWARQLAKWERAHRALKRRVRDKLAPDAQMEYVLYQTLVGMWPTREPAAGERSSLCERVSEFAQKAAREAKARTSWTDPDEEYESALATFIRSLFARAEFLRELQAFVGSIAPAGAWNAIARCVLHLTSPGLPDIYQGDELWSYTLVDPDNRRPVAYDKRERLLSELDAMSPTGDISQLLSPLKFTSFDNDALKLAIIRNLLRARAACHHLFAHGSYQPLAAHGPRAEHIVAFARRLVAPFAPPANPSPANPSPAAIIVVPRLTHAFAPAAPPIAEIWQGTVLHLPAELAGTHWRDAISGLELTTSMHASTDPASPIAIPIAAVLATAPVAVLLAIP
jgi:(1->4)-alpha-D-glucan 1-alpha-D-glucosylmutase